MVKKFKAQTIKELETRVKELETNWKRALADYQNLEARVKKQTQQFVTYATEGVIEKLVGVLDDLERAANHHGDEWLRLIIMRLRGILKEEGAEEIRSTDAEFDPLQMECVGAVPGPNNRVVNTLAVGWKYRGKILRPAKVEVGSSATDRNPESGEGSDRRSEGSDQKSEGEK